MKKGNEYDLLVAETRKKANASQTYYRIEWNSLFNHWFATGVPWPKNQCGSDLKGELISPDKYHAHHHK